MQSQDTGATAFAWSIVPNSSALNAACVRYRSPQITCKFTGYTVLMKEPKRYFLAFIKYLLVRTVSCSKQLHICSPLYSLRRQYSHNSALHLWVLVASFVSECDSSPSPWFWSVPVFGLYLR